jgi:Fe2+ or Zn2+ uptake regulation protein
MENKTSITGVLGFKPSVADILAYMIENADSDHTSTEVAAGVGIGKGTARIVLSQLNALGVVRITRTLSKMNLYAVNNESKIAMLLVELFNAIKDESGTEEEEIDESGAGGDDEEKDEL